METFSALLAICVGNSQVPGEIATPRPVTRSFDIFFDLRLNKRFIKQWWGWSFETLSRPLWRHRNVIWHWWQTPKVQWYFTICLMPFEWHHQTYWIHITKKLNMLRENIAIVLSSVLAYSSCQPTWIDCCHSGRVLSMHMILHNVSLNSLRPSDAYMRRWTNHNWFR